MLNNEEWEKIKQQEENRKIEIRNKFKVDLDQNVGEKLEKLKETIKKTKYSFIIILLIIIIIAILNVISSDSKRFLKEYVLIDAYSKVEETASKTYLFSRGFYTYKFTNIPEIEFNVLYISKDELKIDIEDRYHKYFFDKWEDIEKDKFVVKETYEDCKYKLTQKTNWILHYETYIEANSYEEVMNATDIIIRFLKYMNHDYILPNCYIKVGEKYILPHNVSYQTDDKIRENARREYLNIINTK